MTWAEDMRGYCGRAVVSRWEGGKTPRVGLPAGEARLGNRCISHNDEIVAAVPAATREIVCPLVRCGSVGARK